MNKDVDQLHIDLLDVKDTTEHNGVEVKIPNQEWSPRKVLKCLSFIKAVYVDSSVYDERASVNEFNNRVVWSYKNFKVLSTNTTYDCHRILLGLIPYKVDYLSLWGYDDKHRAWSDAFLRVYPTIDIGQVDITPNRESLLYSERTKEVLRKTYDACIEELEEMWKNQCDEEFDNIKDYADSILFYRNNWIKITDDYTIPIPRALSYAAKYKNRPEWMAVDFRLQKEVIHKILYGDVKDFMLGWLSGNVLSQANLPTLKNVFCTLLDRDYKITILALPSKAGFSSPYFKGYVSDTYGNNVLMVRQLPKKLSHHAVRRYLIDTFGITLLSNKDTVHFIFQFLRELLDYFKSKVIVTDITGSAEYESYKKAHSIKKVQNRTFTGRLVFTITDPSSRTSIKRTDTIDGIIEYVQRDFRRCRIVYSDLDNVFVKGLMSMKYPNLVILSVAKNYMKYLQEGLPKWAQPIEVLYSPDNRTLQRYAAVREICKQISQPSRIAAPDRFILKHIAKMMKELGNYIRVYEYSNRYELVDANDIINIVPPEKYDRQVMALYKQCEKYIKISEKLAAICDMRSYIDFYILIKNKKLRVGYEFYTRIKEYVNEIINVI